MPFIFLHTGQGSGGGGIIAETDPTVPTWAKTPQKPTYTAEEVGAAPIQHAHSEYLTEGSFPLWSMQQNKPAYQADEITLTDPDSGQAVDVAFALQHKAAVGHTHGKSSLETDVHAWIDGKAAESHAHPMAQVEGLQQILSEIDAGGGVAHEHSMAQVTNLMEALDMKADRTKSVALGLRAGAWKDGKQIVPTEIIQSASQYVYINISRYADEEAYLAYAKGLLHVTHQEAGRIILTVRGEIPTVDIPIVVEVRE